MRLFVAVELPERVQRLLSRLIEPLGEYGVPPRAMVRTENLHITAKFLGEVAESQVAELCCALKSGLSGEPFELRAERIECLPHRGPVRIIGVGFGGAVEQLISLQASVEMACEQLGFPKEQRKYRPHATIARLKIFLPSSARRRLDGAVLRPLPSDPFRVDHVTLFESHLGPGGSRYVPLARFPLDEIARRDD